MTARGAAVGARGRGSLRPVRSIGLLLVACGLGAIPARAWAAGLPDDLVAAAALIPVDAADGNGRQVCVQVSGLGNQLRVGTVQSPPDGSASAGRGYTAATTGIYLGNGPSGVPAPPFVQALVDAGAADRLAVTWVDHRMVPSGALPQLQDTGTVGGAGRPPPPAYATRDKVMTGDAYVVRGPDRDLFRPLPNDWLAPVPLRVFDGVATKAQAGMTLGEPPQGLRSATWICYPLLPVRVLEYVDPQEGANGVREVTAAILFHPARLPVWASDYRTFEAMPRHIQPNVARVVTFRSDGDGWRPEPFAKWNGLAGGLHLVGQD